MHPMKTTLKQQAYTTIRSKILRCEYEPNAFLNEDFLCQELNMSRTPVRDALSRLEQENLVKIMPKKGFLVAPLSLNEINIIYETRILLEPYIIRTYGHKISKELQERMELIMKTMEESIDDMERIYDLDDEFHRLIVHLCSNKYLISCYDSINAQNLRLRVLSGHQNRARLIATQEEHMDILRQIVKKDYDKAADAIEKHLSASKEAAYRVL